MLRIYDTKGKSLISQKYDGMYFPFPLTDQEIGEHLSELRNMPTRGDDVLITSYPKSGTHWLLEAVHMLLNNTLDYFQKDFPSPTGKSDGLPLLEYMLINELESFKSPRLMISHLKPKKCYGDNDYKGKIIHLTRNPKDVAVSYYHFIRSLKTVNYEGEWNDFIPLFIAGTVNYGSLFDHVERWKEFSNVVLENKICFITYEELHEDFVSCMAKISTFLGLSIDTTLLQQIHSKCDIKAMRISRATMPDVYADSYIKRTVMDENSDALYRKGIVGDWKHWFTVGQSELFDSMLDKDKIS